MYHDFSLSKWLHWFLYPNIWINKIQMSQWNWLGVKRIFWNCLNPLSSASSQDYIKIFIHILVNQGFGKICWSGSQLYNRKTKLATFFCFFKMRKNLHLCRSIFIFLNNHPVTYLWFFWDHTCYQYQYIQNWLGLGFKP